MGQYNCDLLVKSSCLICNDQEGTVVNDAAIAVSGGKIIDAGEASAIECQYRAEVVKNMGEALIMPGLINAHTHVPMTFLRGFADDLPLMEWLTKYIFPVEAQLTAEIVRLGARWGMYEMMRTGTTAFVDSYLLEEEILNTAEQMGMRCVGGEVVFGFPSRVYGSWEEARELYGRHATEYPAGGRVQVALMPHSVYTTSDDVLRGCVELAEELDLMLHIHLSESKGEVERSMELHGGKRPVAYANAMGLLNKRSVFAHTVEMTDEEIEAVAVSGGQVVHNPVSNLKLASGIARVAEMRAKGVSVALGTDGACSNNTLDMFETMKLAAILAKGRQEDAMVLPAVEALKMATVEGARIFRTPGLGVIQAGSPADMVALDLSEPNLNPMFNPVSHVVYAASGKDCIMTMVDGRILYEQGSYYDGLYEDTRAEMKELVNWVRSKA